MEEMIKKKLTIVMIVDRESRNRTYWIDLSYIEVYVRQNQWKLLLPEAGA